MSQRGGSVSSDVRYGQAVYSPMVPDGAADYLVVLDADQVEINRHYLRAGGVLISVDMINVSALASQKSVNISLLGTLSNLLEFDTAQWLTAVRAALPGKLHDSNIDAFNHGRAVKV
jgi:indolepyruvate ferredoxin oxidoreductase beta subunit